MRLLRALPGTSGHSPTTPERAQSFCVNSRSYKREIESIQRENHLPHSHLISDRHPARGPVSWTRAKALVTSHSTPFFFSPRNFRTTLRLERDFLRDLMAKTWAGGLPEGERKKLSHRDLKPTCPASRGEPSTSGMKPAQQAWISSLTGTGALSVTPGIAAAQ